MAALPNCIICLSAFPDWNALSALACGHVFHYTCIADWGRQCEEKGNPSSCPSCMTRFETSDARGIVRRLYFTFEDETEVARRTRELSELQFKLTLTETMLKSANEQLELVTKRETEMREAQEEKRKQKEKFLNSKLEAWKKEREAVIQNKERERGLSVGDDQVASELSSITPPAAVDAAVPSDQGESGDAVLPKSTGAGVEGSRGLEEGAYGGASVDVVPTTTTIVRSSPDSAGSSQFSSCFSSPLTPSDMTPSSPKFLGQTQSAFKPYGFTTAAPVFCFASLASKTNGSSAPGAESVAAVASTSDVRASTSSAFTCYQFSATPDDSPPRTSQSREDQKTISSQRALFSFGVKPASATFSDASVASRVDAESIVTTTAVGDGPKGRTWPTTVSSATRRPIFSNLSSESVLKSHSPFLSTGEQNVKNPFDTAGGRNPFLHASSSSTTTTTTSEESSFKFSFPRPAQSFPSSAPPSVSSSFSFSVAPSFDFSAASGSSTSFPSSRPSSVIASSSSVNFSHLSPVATSRPSSVPIFSLGPRPVLPSVTPPPPPLNPFVSLDAARTSAVAEMSTTPTFVAPKTWTPSIQSEKKLTGFPPKSSKMCFSEIAKPLFGSAPLFTKPTKSSSSATAAPSVATPSVPSFAAPTAPSFAKPSAPSFAKPSAPSFAAPTVPSFTTPAVSLFAAPTVPSFTARVSKPTTSVSSSKPIFGVPSSLTQKNIFAFPSPSNAQDFWTAAASTSGPTEGSGLVGVTSRGLGSNSSSPKRSSFRKARRRHEGNTEFTLPSSSASLGEPLKSPVASIEGENLDGDDVNEPYERNDDVEGDIVDDGNDSPDRSMAT